MKKKCFCHSYLELQPFETHRAMHHDRGMWGLGTVTQEYSTLEHFTGPIAIDYSAKMAMPKLCDPLLTSHLN